MNLITNRYNQKSPTVITSNGLSISTPIYLGLTNDQAKQILNAFRSIVAKQRRELGYVDTPRSVGQLSVETKTTPPTTPAEDELGMSEESLRFALFGRNGTPERLVLKLCRITCVHLTTRTELEQVFSLWLDEWYPTDEQSTTQQTCKPSQEAQSTRATKAKASAVVEAQA